MDRVPLLVATKGPLKGQRYAVNDTGLVLGRDDDCDVIIPDVGVSRQHARVILHNAAVWVQDEGSRNGVFVNGKRVVRHRQLSPGSELLIGDHAFTLELAPAFPDDPSTVQTSLSVEQTESRPAPLPLARIAGVSAVAAVLVVVLLYAVGVL
jgi:pSer/pThr/pTyr-binding forkhead associated (FHA) protein